MGGEVIVFVIGIFVGGALGYIAAGVTFGARSREDSHLSAMLLRVMIEKDPTLWPYRIEKWIDTDGTVIRTFFDADDRIHHIDKGTIQ